MERTRRKPKLVNSCPILDLPGLCLPPFGAIELSELEVNRVLDFLHRFRCHEVAREVVLAEMLKGSRCGCSPDLDAFDFTKAADQLGCGLLGGEIQFDLQSNNDAYVYSSEATANGDP